LLCSPWAINARDIQQAQQEFAVVEAQWRRMGFRVVPPELLNQGEAALQSQRAKVEQWDAQLDDAKAQLQACWREYRTFAAAVKWYQAFRSYVFLVIILFIAVAFSVGVGALVWSLNGPAIGIGAGILCIVSSQIVTCGWVLMRDKLKEQVERVTRGMRGTSDRIAQMEHAMPIGEKTRSSFAAECDTIAEQLDCLRQLASLPDRYRQAEARYKEVRRIIESRQFQLANCAWRSLAGGPFERFLVEVFENLGYAVQWSGRTGDGGADIVAKGKGRGVVIQAKGYPSGATVGTDAVQEAHTGKALHKCDVAVVITNSALTRPARNLARSIGCVVIEQDGIVDLIHGKRGF
jgi:hypothetical protein